MSTQSRGKKRTAIIRTPTRCDDRDSRPTAGKSKNHQAELHGVDPHTALSSSLGVLGHHGSDVFVATSCFATAVNVSSLSGVQALEEFLPSRNTAVAQGDRGRHRALLSTLYDAYAALGKEPLMVHHVHLTWTDTAYNSWRKQ